MKFKLLIEYDGTLFKGWQIHKQEYTIQGSILDACYKIFNTQNLELYGAGRTDAGVHAIEQTAHLEVDTNLQDFEIKNKLNALLPASVFILDVQKTHDRFHARHSATARSYVYIISKRKSAFFKKYIWWIPQDLNISAMQNAAQLFVGMHNYISFGKLLKKDESTLVEIKHMSVSQANDSIIIHIIGSHFLRSQIRRMTGVLVEIGKGNLSENDVQLFLETQSERPGQLTAPPSGLFLEKVYYNNEAPNKDIKIPIVI